MDLFFISIYLINLISYIDRGIIFTLLPTLAQDFNLSQISQGFLVSTFMIGYVLASLIFSILVKYIDKIRLLGFGFCIFFFSTASMLIIDNKEGLFILRSISGFGEGSFQVIVPYLLNQVYGEKNGNKKISILYTSINIGTSIGILIGGVIEKWKYIYTGLAISEIIIFTLFVLNSCVTYKIKDDNTKSDYEKIKTIITNPHWVISTILMGILCFSLGTLSTWIPTLYDQQYSDEVSFPILASIISGSFIFCSILGSYLGDRWSNYLLDKHESYICLYKIGVYVNSGLLVFVYLSLFFIDNIYISIGFFILFLTLISIIIIPNSLINILSVPISSRIYSNSLCIFMVHFIGDMPSPVISSYIWHKTNNLITSLEYSQISLAITFVIYLICFIRCSKKNSFPLMAKLVDIEVI